MSRVVLCFHSCISPSNRVLHFLSDDTAHLLEVLGWQILKGVQAIEVRLKSLQNLVRGVAGCGTLGVIERGLQVW